ncbi:uncharacterized protein BROUX77_006286 [Berkeleyomyces rouxiae]|uniref:uncharacterized protein n=1 Tax=Berkeleyomyces rouxiae TaxID=2035830 RepID=UPI003B76FA09
MALTREMIEHLNTFLLSIPDRTPENWHLGALPREFSAEIKMAIVAVVQWYSTWQGFSVGYREVVGSIPTSDANFLRAVNLNWGTWG